MLGYKEISCPEDECSRDVMLCWMCGNTRRDKMRNENIHTKIGVASIEETIRETAYDGLVMCDVDLQMRQSAK